MGSSGTYGREEHCTNAAEAGIRTVQPLLHMIVNIPLLYVCTVRRRQHTSSSRPPPVAPIRLHNKIPPPSPAVRSSPGEAEEKTFPCA